MRSVLAGLRTLVLPFGATTGPRIVLDGINGQILVYDSHNQLVGVMQGDTTGGFVKFNSSGGSDFVKLSNSLITLQPQPPFSAEAVDPAFILTSSDAGTSQTYLQLHSPADDAHGLRSLIKLFGSANSLPTDTHIQFDAAGEFQFTGGARPTFDGSPGVTGNRPRIEVGRAIQTTDVTGITTTETVVDTVLNVPLVAGRLYDIEWDGNITSSVVGGPDAGQLRLRTGSTTAGTNLGITQVTPSRATSPAFGHITRSFTAPSTGAFDFCCTLIRAYGTGSYSRLAAGSFGPSLLRVWEYG